MYTYISQVRDHSLLLVPCNPVQYFTQEIDIANHSSHYPFF